MKKLIAILLVLTMVLSFAACGGEKEEKREEGSSLRDAVGTVGKDHKPAEKPERPTEKPEEKPTEKPEEKPEGGFSMDEVVVVDNDECVIRITGAEINDYDEFTLKAYLENKSSDTTYMYTVMDATVNGISSDPLFAMEVAPGKKAQKEISFWDDSLEENNVTRFTDIGLSFRVYNTDDYMADPVAEPMVHIYPYGEDQAERFVREPQDSDIVLVDTDEITVVAIGKEYDELWGQSVKIFIDNRTDNYLMVTADDVSVNGYMVDPFFATEISPDSCGFDNINWSNDRLAENGIEDLEEIEMKLRIYDNENWSADDLVSETITFQP